MKQRGFGLIETMVSIVFVMAIVFMLMGGFNSANSISIGMNGVLESRCIDGYRVIVDQEGRPRQLLDELGKGVKCENPNAGKPGAFGKM